MSIDTSELHPAFSTYVGTQHRVKVETVYRDDEGTVRDVHVRCGRIGKTTGTRPAYLVMHNSRAIGSSDVILPDTPNRRTRVIAVKQRDDRRYTTLLEPTLTDRIGWHTVEEAS